MALSSLHAASTFLKREISALMGIKVPSGLIFCSPDITFESVASFLPTM